MLSVSICSINAQENTLRKQLFDNEWKFFLGEVKGAEKPTFNDISWRDIDLPHDWSIENLPGQEPGKIVGPFSKESIGATATGYTVGGTAWYRKTFTLNPKQTISKTIICFDGVYMNSEVWVNGKPEVHSTNPMRSSNHAASLESGIAATAYTASTPMS